MTCEFDTRSTRWSRARRDRGTGLAVPDRMYASTLPSRFLPLPHSAELVSLIRAEYIEMPGLSLTLAQAARLWNVDRRQCLDALEILRAERFLDRCRESYVRRSSVHRGA